MRFMRFMRPITLIAACLFAMSSAARGEALVVETRLLGTDKPVAGAKIKWRLEGGSEGSGQTDVDGRFVIPGLTEPPVWGSVEASAGGMVPLAIRWNKKPTTLPLVFRMEKGTKVGGRIVDDAGTPIAGATVVVSVVKKYPDSDQRVGISWHDVKTDAKGAWSLDGVPADADEIKLAAYDLLHIEDTSYDTEPYAPREALLNQTAKLTLPRGTPIDVTVLKPDGSPAAGAEVFFGSMRHVVNCLAPTHADAQGKARLAGKPGVASALTAFVKGCAPAQASVTFSDKPQQVTLRLTPPVARTVEVVDSTGKPIKGATVRASEWRGTTVLSANVTTDDAGRATWTDGPTDAVKVDIHAAGYTGKNDFPWEAGGSVPRVALVKPTQVVGRVLDAQTGKPIDDYSIRGAAVWNAGERMVWQSTSWLDVERQKSSGEFKLKLGNSAHQFLLRVSAPGHLPQDVGPFTPDGTARDFELRLTPAPNVTGRLLTPDGTPVAGADVFLVIQGDWMGVQNGAADADDSMHTKSGPDGSFSLPPQKDDFALIVLGEHGTATLRREELTGAETVVRVQPWARVRGTISVEGRPAGDLVVYGNAEPAKLADGTTVIDRRYYFTTKDGKFDIPRAAAGKLRLTREIPNYAPGRSWYVTLGVLDLKGGDDVEVHLGKGPAVSGRLEIPAGKQWMIRLARAEPKGQPHQEGMENVDVRDDGHFRAADLKPGDYTLHVALHELPPDNTCGWGRVVGEYRKDFTIAQGAAVTELGSVAPLPIKESALKVGDAAPDFTAKTLDSREMRLSEMKGKVVLIDFWATWCAPCVNELPNLKKIAAEHANDDRFVIAGLSVDENVDDLRRFVKAVEITWPQACVGFESAVVHAYGATAVPLTILVGPDGKIVARDLRGEELDAAVRAALAE